MGLDRSSSPQIHDSTPLVTLWFLMGTMKRYALILALIFGCKDCSSPVATTDIGTEIPSLGSDSSVDLPEVDADTPSVCPEGVHFNSRGEPIGVQSERVRHCWPSEDHCFCDVDGDCYALVGYTPCSPPSRDI